MQKYIVMTASAQMPHSCWGTYRRVAVVEIDPDYIAVERMKALVQHLPPPKIPAMISERAKGIMRIVKTWEQLHVGKTERCAYARALAKAKALADAMNTHELLHDIIGSGSQH